jgi:hypothetical protein
VSIAGRANKLPIGAVADDRRWRVLEDLLTADVFGVLRYLPPELGILPVLARAERDQATTLADWCAARGLLLEELTRVRLAFWPELAEKEPDIVIDVAREDGPPVLTILIEAKYRSEQHTIDGKSQLGFYGSLLFEAEADFPFEEQPSQHRVVIFLTAGRERPDDQLCRARDEAREYVGEGRCEFFWTNWQSIQAVLAGGLREGVEAPPRHVRALLDDALADLEERGFGPPRQLTSWPMPALPPLPWLPSGSLRRLRPAIRRSPQVAGLRVEPLPDITAALHAWRIR